MRHPAQWEQEGLFAEFPEPARTSSAKGESLHLADGTRAQYWESSPKTFEFRVGNYRGSASIEGRGSHGKPRLYAFGKCFRGPENLLQFVWDLYQRQRAQVDELRTENVGLKRRLGIEEPCMIEPAELGFDVDELRTLPKHEAPFAWGARRAFEKIDESGLSVSDKKLAKVVLVAHQRVASEVRYSCYVCPRSLLCEYASVCADTLDRGHGLLAELDLLRIRRRRIPKQKENLVNGYMIVTTREAGGVADPIGHPLPIQSPTPSRQNRQTVEGTKKPIVDDCSEKTALDRKRPDDNNNSAMSPSISELEKQVVEMGFDLTKEDAKWRKVSHEKDWDEDERGWQQWLTNATKRKPRIKATAPTPRPQPKAECVPAASDEEWARRAAEARKLSDDLKRSFGRG